MSLFQPTSAKNTLLNQIEAVDPGDGLELWWLGKSGFLVKSSVGRVLFDPCIVAADRNATHEVILPGTPKSIDVVAVSPKYADRLNATDLKRVFDANPKAALLVPELGRKSIAGLLGCDPTWPWGLDDGESVSFGELTILAAAAGCDSLNFDATGRCNELDYVVWFGDMKVYYGTAMQMEPELIERTRALAIDVAILPMDGGCPVNRDANRFGEDAVLLAHAIRAQLLVLYSGNSAELTSDSRALLDEKCKLMGQPFTILNCGDRILVESTTLNSRADRGV